MSANVIQIGETRRYTAAKQAITARANRIGASAEQRARALAVAIRELQQGRSTGAAVALANTSLGGTRNWRLMPGGVA